MNTEARQITLAQILFSIKDNNRLDEIEAFLTNDKSDWWDELSNDTKQSIERGIKQADEGKVISHKQARTRIDKFFKENV
tara:strand:- start:576 stop:815 length:240 start_codon:yes stop_codon:yes gene_type:complete